MDWLIILGMLTAIATFFSQVSTIVKNSVDTYYKIKEEKEKKKRAAPTKKSTPNNTTGESNLPCN
ncbi:MULTISPECIES: hypothetical protein [unclassified Bacillus (in: firmicutes)]|uniref:hypothetical protein n=1 Tax=unclassified Bacillus (in: firmicutes) TaxID=185979 RepID=UPI001ABEF8BC|nr:MULTISPECIES: hypothetical protein [unclassified Bacillus (in: firmicutes)]